MDVPDEADTGAGSATCARHDLLHPDILVLGAVAWAARRAVWMSGTVWFCPRLAGVTDERRSRESGCRTDRARQEITRRRVSRRGRGGCRFAFQTGLVSDAGLVTAIDKAKSVAIANRNFVAPEMIEVYQRVAIIKTKILPSTMAAIKGGWRPNGDKTRETITNVAFVILAVFVTLAVGHLTLIHSRGTALAADLIRLDEANPGLQFGILERRLLRAQEFVFSDNGSNAAAQTATANPMAEAGGEKKPGSNQPNAASSATQIDPMGSISLAQDSMLRDAYDLSVLNQRLLSARARTNQLIVEAYGPYPRLAAVYGGIVNGLDSLSGTAKWLLCLASGAGSEKCAVSGSPPPAGITKGYEANYVSLGEASLPVFCGYIDKIRQLSHGQAQTIDDADKYLDKVKYVFGPRFGYDNVERVVQNCSIGLSYLWNTIPDVRSLIDQVKAITTLYAFIILPSLYGALGSFMYFLRRSLDPYSPNLSILRMSYRVAIGGLAGLAVAYFWSGGEMTGDSFANAGFGLFLVTFVFGFSIEVFFAFLDRLVELSTAGVKNIGASDPAYGASGSGGGGSSGPGPGGPGPNGQGPPGPGPGGPGAIDQVVAGPVAEPKPAR